MTTRYAMLGLALLAATTHAQTHGHGHAPSPYSAMTHREVKALSDEQLSDLRAGRGMSLALPAELNGYPGPKHALELADALELTAAQRRELGALVSAMTREATALGSRIIDSERALDSLFASGAATAQRVQTATAEAASLQGQLRLAHLKYHLTTRELLTAAQTVRYNELRGYRNVHRP